MLAGATLAAVILAQWPTLGSSIAPSQCEDFSAEAPVIGSNLLQVQASRHDDSFGPGGCIGLSRSSAGTCVLRTNCPDAANIENVEFAFVCVNPSSTMPHALHSFGRGGFEASEMFDTGVFCKTCLSIETAYKEGHPLMHNALAALPQGRLAAHSMPGTHLSGADMRNYDPEEMTHFGPSACVSTFLSPGESGTCLIRTRCKGVDLSGFNIGVTCLDNSGGYTRYLFGKDVFQPEETFDTLLQCFRCLGVGAESSIFASHSALPKRLMEDVGSLKTNVESLEERVRVLSYSAKPPPEPKRAPISGDAAGHVTRADKSSSSGADENRSSRASHTSHASHTENTNDVIQDMPTHEDAMEEAVDRIPTIMVERPLDTMALPGPLDQGNIPMMTVFRQDRKSVV